MSEYELIASKGCGSAVIEMALALAGLPHRVTLIPYLEPGPGRERLLSHNPLGQVPTLILPDGTAMTESAAMVLHIHDVAPQAELVPPDVDNRAVFFNLLVVLVGAVYPTFTFGDEPKQLGLDDAAAARLRGESDARRMRIWRHMETLVSPAPYALGSALTALDLYLVVMTAWNPGRAWFAEHCPKLLAAADAAAQIPAVARVRERNA
ncbi:glutathione S-transferase family protein [Microvirga sp. BT689]|uniref:glutathione S-transferase family protein n=1 Tax=Microvirga arvi TaxID=2778731 RepID=UPI001952689C|nr:glutathione S-transferase family protein [Microvirga arvi]MBM6582525.1 glutathione S-transferase family protein [Microvirga arvi]